MAHRCRGAARTDNPGRSPHQGASAMTAFTHQPDVDMRTAPTTRGAVTGRPRLILRAEGAVLLAAMLLAFGTTDQRWWLVPVLLSLPDLAMAGYARSSRLGALTYNL